MVQLETNQANLDKICINTIRTLSIDAVQKANSGHPGAPLGLAPAAYILWTKFLKHNPKNPNWFDRDRFVLSGGHASMLLYSILHLTGYDISIEDICNFRQLESKTPGHPEYGVTPGVETSTGPLGQGFATSVGLAMAERHLASCFNNNDFEIIDHYTYVFCGDGDLMEGISSEAASLAGHLGLGKLICIYDDNKISIEGSTDIAFTEDVAMRFKAYNWHVQVVSDGNDICAIEKSINAAKQEREKPSILLLRTQIAYGSPNKQGTSDAHGSPLGEEEVRLTKKNLGCPQDACFCVPQITSVITQQCLDKGENAEISWQKKFKEYENKYPELFEKLNQAIENILPKDWDKDIPDFSKSKPIATRSASGKILNAISQNVSWLMGGSADLAPSNMTLIESSKDFQKNSYNGRNIRFGVREQSMGAILSGLFLHKGIRPFGGTFFVFADYMRSSIRLASLMKLPVIYIFTHDSIAVGEDGPTHQPIEHLASLRIIPNLIVIRPADAVETVFAWRFAMQNKKNPVALILSRQNLPIIDRTKYAEAKGLINGAYILAESKKIEPDIILIASGSEVNIAIEAKELLDKENFFVRVVSMPSWELFEKMPKEYKESVFPSKVINRLAIEAGSPFGWERYVGDRGNIIGISDFGMSAPGNALIKKFGFTVENIVKCAKEMIIK